MAGGRSLTMWVGAEFDVLCTVATAAEFAEAVGMDLADVITVEIVAGELAENLVRHAGGGRITVSESDALAVEIVADDDGPGFADVRDALTDGYSRGRMLDPDNRIRGVDGLGSGLGAVARLSDDFSIANKPEGGAHVVALKRTRTRA